MLRCCRERSHQSGRGPFSAHRDVSGEHQGAKPFFHLVKQHVQGGSTMRKTAIAVAIIGLFVVPALAQTPPTSAPVWVRGTVEKLDGQNLTVKSRDGQSLAIALAPNIIVS